jgi:hypothetical protein
MIAVMSTSNSDAMRWHPAAGRNRIRTRTRNLRPSGDADIIDLATERALRLLAQAGMIAAPRADLAEPAGRPPALLPPVSPAQQAKHQPRRSERVAYPLNQ